MDDASPQEAAALLRAGIAAAKAGRREEARDLLQHAVEKDEASVGAWLWLSSVVDDEAKSGCGRVRPTMFLRTRAEAIPAEAVKVRPEADLFPPILHSREWQEPVPLPGPINTAGAEDSPFITPDGQSFYFFFTPDVRVPPEKQLLDGVTGIWWSRRSGDTWSEPQRVILNDDLSLDGCEWVQGERMYFCSARQGNYRDVDLWTAEFRDGAWSHWQNAGKQLNVDYQVGEMHLSADGTALYFHSLRPGGRGQMDIWVTRQVDGTWQEPENVAALNTPGDEGWPFLTQDSAELWFTRFYQGYPAIFRSQWVDGAWSAPELIVSQFAGEPTLDGQGNLYFTHHFYRDGQMIEADIYVAYRRE